MEDFGFDETLFFADEIALGLMSRDGEYTPTREEIEAEEEEAEEDWDSDDDDWHDDEDDEWGDVEADADTFASAGWGTDEDY